MALGDLIVTISSAKPARSALDAGFEGLKIAVSTHTTTTAVRFDDEDDNEKPDPMRKTRTPARPDLGIRLEKMRKDRRARKENKDLHETDTQFEDDVKIDMEEMNETGNWESVSFMFSPDLDRFAMLNLFFCSFTVNSSSTVSRYLLASFSRGRQSVDGLDNPSSSSISGLQIDWLFIYYSTGAVSPRRSLFLYHMLPSFDIPHSLTTLLGFFSRPPNRNSSKLRFSQYFGTAPRCVRGSDSSFSRLLLDSGLG